MLVLARRALGGTYIQNQSRNTNFILNGPNILLRRAEAGLGPSVRGTGLGLGPCGGQGRVEGTREAAGVGRGYPGCWHYWRRARAGGGTRWPNSAPHLGGPSGPYSKRPGPACPPLLLPATPRPALPCASTGTWLFLVALGGEGRGLLLFWLSREKDHDLSCSCPVPGPFA